MALPYYKYVINYTGEVIDSVDVYDSPNGEPVSISTPKNAIWDFKNGIGPFNSSYAAIDKATGDVAFQLDPNDLSKKLDGTTYTMDDYNIVWMVPTVYWSVSGNALTLSNDPNEGTAYAHTLGGSVRDYIGIGVYEATSVQINGNDCLMSQSGKTPQAEKTIVQFDTMAHNTPGSTLMWNFYQWTFVKIATYMIGMGKNTQAIWGAGNVDGSTPSNTGLGDTAGPYVSFDTSLTTTAYSKVLIENSWGSIWQWVGDTVLSNKVLYAGQNTTGIDYTATTGKTAGSTMPGTGWITGTSKNAADWDLTTASDATGINDHECPVASASGDAVAASQTGIRVLMAGGNCRDTDWNGISRTSENNTSTTSRWDMGARLAYYFDGLKSVSISMNQQGKGTINGSSAPAEIPVASGSTVTVSGDTITAGGVTIRAKAGFGGRFLGWRTSAGFVTSALTVTADTAITAVFGNIDSYVYVMNYTGERIDSVDVYSGNGARTNVTASKDAIWNFKGAYGPFNSCYAAIDKTTGQVAFHLNPNNLRKKIDGSSFTMDDYNIVWLIPTVYWTVMGDSLIMSDVPTEGTAYAHSVTTPAAKTYAYIGIGVYEATSDVIDNKNCMMSQSGKTPTVNKSITSFDTDGQNTPGTTILWNFYHWTFTKMAIYMVGMSKNAQVTWGAGNVDSSAASQTGLGDTAGPYVSFDTSLSSTAYSKVFIENTWGSLYQWLGSANFSNRTLYLAQTSGGVSYSSGVGSSTGFVMPGGDGWVTQTSKDPALWDMPSALSSTENSSDPDYPGDLIISPAANAVRVISVSGRYDNKKNAGLDRIYAGSYNTSSYASATTGARLAYFLDEDPAALVQSIASVKVGSDWKKARPFVKVDGSWRPAQVSVNDGGVWSPVIAPTEE